MCAAGQTDFAAVMTRTSDEEMLSNWCETRYCSVGSGARGVVVMISPPLSLSLSLSSNR